jgi:hypothetical protein
MKLQRLFKKAVDRPIEGVIKADDEASLKTEIEEYVLTREVEKRLENFLYAYNNYEVANGVWISGFFGSGKSHLLKMLALLLEDREVDGVSSLELFLPKCGDNEILRGDLKRAVSIPSKSILFNIDQKADVISKTQIDALLSVFVKVFDEMCGYYGKQGHIASFERDLDGRGLLQPFRAAFQELAGVPWEKGREQALLESGNIAKAYAQVSGGDEAAAIGILDKYRAQYRVSIEDFAEQVKAYVDRQPSGFRLNFFVDEVGQYIAENVKLMTNLQTIAESLATKCRGQAWVIVTSQNDMSAVLGEMNKQQSNDFSKIQARFANKMLLTSTNVSEVIQKRLLAKTDDGAERVSDLYHQHSTNFGTLFGFTDGSREYKPYKGRDEFIHSYPFAPYQFDLFQAAIESLSRHNAFEGKHSSVGERSMLGVFQQVAIHIGDQQLGQLATFDLMFEGIRTALKASVQSAVLMAERQLDDAFAVRILKALFLVKYVREFKATVRNLCILMTDAFDQDMKQLSNRVEEALNRLELQTYIQRNGDLYEYLTDDEKDVEEEIKHTEVENDSVMAELEKIVFDGVISAKYRKIRHDKSGQDFAYARKLDDRLHGRDAELVIHVITPFHEHADKEEMHRSDTVFRDELRLVLPQDDRLVRDLMMYKRTEKYIQQNVSMTQQDNIKRILDSKGSQNRERYADLQQRARLLVGRAKLFVGGNEIESQASDGQSRILQAFQDLVAKAYPNLGMLRGAAFSENDIGKHLRDSPEGLFGNDASNLSEPEREMLAFIQSNSRGGLRTTIKSLLERFEKKPYGWHFAAVLCILAKLCARGKIEVRSDGNLLEDSALEKALLNTHGHANVVLEPQVEYNANQVRRLKELYEDFFDNPPASSEAKALGKETTTAFQTLHHDLDKLFAQQGQYPFLAALEPVLARLKELGAKPYGWQLTELAKQEDSLLDLKEGLIDPIRKFIHGPQKDIFDEARHFVQAQESNFAYIESDDIPELQAALVHPECFKGNRVQQMKTRLDNLKALLEEKRKAVRAEAISLIQAMQQRMQGMDEYQKLPEVRQADLDKPYQDLIEHIRQQQLIAVINDRLRHFEEQGYQKLLARMVELATPKLAEPEPDADPDTPTPPKVKELKVEYVAKRQIQVDFDKAWLQSEADVDRYLQSMRTAMLAEIQKGKRIQV